MFLLNTNILSAVMGTRPAPKVASWMTRQPADLLFTAAASPPFRVQPSSTRLRTDEFVERAEPEEGMYL